MSTRAPDRRQTAPRRDPDAARGSRGTGQGRERVSRRRGPHIGPLGITPVRVILGIALLGGFAFLGYAIFVRDVLQVPLMASGMAVVGLVLAAMAALSLLSVIRAGRDGRDGAAVITSLVGGLFAAAALLALAGAAIMGLIWSSTKAV
jgi:hypothetical protein